MVTCWKAERLELEFLWMQNFFPLNLIQKRTAAHPDSYRGIKRPDCEADHSALIGAEVKITYVHFSIPFRGDEHN
jgi:hypothetical protein